MSNRSSAPLEARGHRKLLLLRKLAKGDHTLRELASQYGVTHAAVHHFKVRHAEEIAKIAENINNQFEGLWIADKSARLSEYQQDVADINEELPDLPVEHKANYRKVKHNALKNAAEELGHLPSRVNIGVQVANINYRIDGVDMDELR